MAREQRKIPGAIWAIGFVSMLMDISSEMVHALLPIYMVTVLGTSALAVGIIEGIAEATAAITKVFSGALSDWLGKRKFLAVLGYGLAALTRPVFPLAQGGGALDKEVTADVIEVFKIPGVNVDFTVQETSEGVIERFRPATEAPPTDTP